MSRVDKFSLGSAQLVPKSKSIIEGIPLEASQSAAMRLQQEMGATSGEFPPGFSLMPVETRARSHRHLGGSASWQGTPRQEPGTNRCGLAGWTLRPDGTCLPACDGG